MEDFEECFDECPRCHSPMTVTRTVLREEKIFVMSTRPESRGRYFGERPEEDGASYRDMYRTFRKVSKMYKCTECNYRNSILAIETSDPFYEDTRKTEL